MTDETPARATPKGPVPKDRIDALDQDQAPDAMVAPDADGEPVALDSRSGIGMGKPKISDAKAPRPKPGG